MIEATKYPWLSNNESRIGEKVGCVLFFSKSKKSRLFSKKIK
jgi:hypothetical protein